MHIEFLVEEWSSKEVLNNLLPKIFDSSISYQIHAFQGKRDLMKKLPNRLRGYKRAYKARLGNDYKIVVLIDEDRVDCKKLKERLENISSDAGLISKSKADLNEPFQILNRIAIEELEAWFFGDIEAIVTAYPKVNKNIANQKKYRNPDDIGGGTAEALKKLLQDKDYYQGKIQTAREISRYMNPKNNRSKSFQVFYFKIAQTCS